ncbi:MAG: hypothetical protein K0S32_3772 [Bacteroidetes bacterium]|jgi:hypothetical protein|nr:hypothetical protein [Bacteroidota bacterium]
MNTLLLSLMITWTDVFEAIGEFFQWCFGGMKAMGHGPNWIFGSLVVFGIAYWTFRLMKYKKIAGSNTAAE